MKLLNNATAFIPAGETPPSNFHALTDLTLVILIGLTGVGKSTSLNLLAQTGVDFTLLPNRRDITDQIIIASLQAEDGEPFQPIFDRVKRFEYTARYRAKYPGGMAHALSRLAIDLSQTKALLIFDGLRGLDEVQHAVTYFPRARFIVLDASDMTRLSRLLKRGDAFDTTAIHTTLATQNLVAALNGVPNIDAIFDEDQLRHIARAARAGEISTDEVIRKVTIIVEERRNYDSNAARVHLTRTLPPKQILVVDTAHKTAAAVAQRMAEWLKEG